ncbi:GumC family protein [Rubellimicrobium mesophilum]|nr:Wzz/FepE/Etk N-terminal domain-containing protein [Rubellimicrobium mesophilum]
MHARNPLRISESEELRFVGRLWRAIWRVRYWAFVAALLSGIVAYLYSLTLEESFTAEARVMLNTSAPPQQPEPVGPLLPVLSMSPTTLQSEIEVMGSLDLIDTVAQQLNLYTDPEFAGSEDESSIATAIDSAKAWVRQTLSSAVDALLGSDEAASSEASEDLDESGYQQVILESIAGNVGVVQLSPLSAVYTISFTSEDPKKAADVANALAETYIDAQTKEVLATGGRLREWLISRTKDSEDELLRLNVELAEQVTSPTSTGEPLEVMQQQRREYAESLASAQARLASLEQTLGPSGSPDATGTPALPDDAAVGNAASGSDAQDIRRRNALESQLQQQRTLVTSLQQSIAEQERRIAEEIEYTTNVSRLESQIRVAERVYESFVELLRRQSNQERFVEPNARIISHARLPLYPSGPRRARLAFVAAVLAAMSVVGLAMAKEAVTRRLRTVREYEEATSLPVLGMIPSTTRLGQGLKGILTNPKRADSVVDRNIRRLRNQIITRAEALGQPEPRVLIGASPLHQEGKTLSITLLAINYAATGDRVLLIDADFWRSGYKGLLPQPTADYWDTVSDPGASEIAVHSVPNTSLDIMVAPTNLTDPAELLMSKSFQDFVSGMRNRYDRVLIDAPPILPLANVLPLYRVADATLLFVRWNYTSSASVQSALKALNSVGVEPLGCVATQIDLRRVHGYSDDEFTHVLAHSSK